MPVLTHVKQIHQLLPRLVRKRDAYRTKVGSPTLRFFQVESAIMEKLINKNNKNKWPSEEFK